MELEDKRKNNRIRRMRTEQRKKEQGYKAFSIYLNPENTAYLSEIKQHLSDTEQPSTNSDAINYIFRLASSKS